MQLGDICFLRKISKLKNNNNNLRKELLKSNLPQTSSSIIHKLLHLFPAVLFVHEFQEKAPSVVDCIQAP